MRRDVLRCFLTVVCVARAAVLAERLAPGLAPVRAVLLFLEDGKRPDWLWRRPRGLRDTDWRRSGGAFPHRAESERESEIVLETENE